MTSPPVPIQNFDQSSCAPPPAQELKGKSTAETRTESRRKIGGDRRHNSLHNNSLISTREHTDWIAEQARKHSEKELAWITGLSLAAAQNLRNGRSGASGATISNWCRHDPEFRIAYFAYCGGQLETDPGFYAHMSQAINHYFQTKRTEE